MKRRDEDGGTAVDLVEDAVGALRAAPAAALAWYYAGTVPFVAAFAYAWMTATPGLSEGVDVVPFALLLTVLYIAMKTAQARFAAHLGASLRGASPAAWSLRAWLRVASSQVLIQVPALVYLPVSLVLMVPFGWVNAYVQNATVFSGDPGIPLAEVRRRSLRQARLWPIQNHFAIWLVSPWLFIGAVALSVLVARLMFALGGSGGVGEGGVLALSLVLLFLVLWPTSPFGFVLGGNMALVVIVLPWILKIVLGIETPFTMSGLSAFSSTAFVMVVCLLTYLVLDPAMKAVYVLRCFRGESQESGADLRSALPLARRLPGLLSAVVLVASAGLLHAAQTPATPLPPAAPAPASYRNVDPVALDRAVREVLADPVYRWRIPHKTGEREVKTGWLSRFFDGVISYFDRILRWTGRQIRRLTEWIEEWLRRLPFGRPSGSSDGGSGVTLGYAVLFVGLAVAACAAVILYLRGGRRMRQEAVQGVPVPARPDLRSEQVLANELPEDEWVSMADELVARGEWRLAMRALFLGGLATLNARSLVRVTRHKTNRDYLAELRRYGHAAPASLEAFRCVVDLFERSWYGMHAATAETVADMRGNMEAIRRHATEA